MSIVKLKIVDFSSSDIIVDNRGRSSFLVEIDGKVKHVLQTLVHQSGSSTAVSQ